MFNCLIGEATDDTINELLAWGKSNPTNASLLAWLANGEEIAEDLTRMAYADGDKAYERWCELYLPQP